MPVATYERSLQTEGVISGAVRDTQGGTQKFFVFVFLVAGHLLMTREKPRSEARLPPQHSSEVGGNTWPISRAVSVSSAPNTRRKDEHRTNYRRRIWIS